LILFAITFLVNQSTQYLDTYAAGDIDFIWYINILAHPLLFVPVIKGIEEHGLYRSILFSSVIQSFAAFFGMTPVFGPWVAEVLNSIASVINFTCLTAFSGAWFGPRGRIYATAFLLTGTFVGSDLTDLLGQALSSTDLNN
jgi:hypothetical protein